VALVTLDPEEAPAFAQEHGLSVEELPGSEAMRAEVQKALDGVNAPPGAGRADQEVSRSCRTT